MGRVVAVTERDDLATIVIEGQQLHEMPVGASLAVDGVCLTAVSVGQDQITVNVVPETLDRTTLGKIEEGAQVNLERPMPADGRFDGHIVQGHVDGVGRITSLSQNGDGTVMTIEPPRDLMSFIVEKGSITVDGVSLTVVGLNDRSFSVALIPHTLEVTTLGLRQPGTAVNLEVDVLAKYVERLLEARK